MLVGKISYFMPDILVNDDAIISYKLPILGVVKCAQISLPSHLFFVLVFFYYQSEKSFKWAVSIEICVRSVFPRSGSQLKKDLSPGSIPILLLLVLYHFHPGPASIPISPRPWSWSCPSPIPISMLSDSSTLRSKRELGPVPGPGYFLQVVLC